MNRILRNTSFYLIMFLVLIGIIYMLTNQGEQQRVLNYSEFLVELENNNIEEVNVQFDGYTYEITGKTRTVSSETGNTLFRTYGPYDPKLVDLLVSRNVQVTMERMQQDSIWLTFLTSIIPIAIIFILFFFLFNQAQGGGGKVMNFGKSRARLYNEEKKARYV